jgi:hypothetical protein
MALETTTYVKCEIDVVDQFSISPSHSIGSLSFFS